MKTDIPRCDGPNPSPEQTCAPTSWTWWALMATTEPPLDLGRSPEHAEEALLARLREFYTRDMDPLPDDPEERALDTLAHYKRGALICCGARDEVGSFLAWKRIASLSGEEALLRWRRVFPALAAPDPLIGVLFTEERAGFVHTPPWSSRKRRSRRP